MNEYLDMILGTNIRKKPICNTCIHQKKGLTTICEKYKRIPSDVQHGKYCVKYLRNEVE